MFLAIYRKYRPKKLNEIIGQKTIIEILKNEAIENKFAHAYLFYGPRGTGKTSTARILAKLANCEKRKNNIEFSKKGEPCNKCEACLSIDNGTAMDIIEIDAASNRGIDDIRNLQENINTLPSRYSKKVIIMDEVHMLTPQAFNALLKTLEEPPFHVIFILATTEYDKVPATIISRTQKFHFRKIPLQKIVEKLEKIIKLEKIKSTKGGLEMIAKLADGSVRDSESLLGQIASMQNEITEKSIENIVGKLNYEKINKMTIHILNKNLNKSLELLYEIYSEGHNLFQFNRDLIEKLRIILSISLSPGLEKLFLNELSESEFKNIKEIVKIAETKYIIDVIKSLISAYSQMKYNPMPIVPLEVAIISSIKKYTTK